MSWIWVSNIVLEIINNPAWTKHAWDAIHIFNFLCIFWALQNMKNTQLSQTPTLLWKVNMKVKIEGLLETSWKLRFVFELGPLIDI